MGIHYSKINHSYFDNNLLLDNLAFIKPLPVFRVKSHVEKNVLSLNSITLQARSALPLGFAH
jgi:hypothetical protein